MARPTSFPVTLAVRFSVIVAVVGVLLSPSPSSADDAESLDALLAVHVEPISVPDCDVLGFLDAMNAAVGHRSLLLPAFEAIPDERANIATRGGPLAEVLDETLGLWGAGWYRQARHVLIAPRGAARKQRELARIESIRVALTRWLDGAVRCIDKPPGRLSVLLAEMGFQKECNGSYFVSPKVQDHLVLPKTPMKGTPRQILGQVLPHGPDGVAVIGDLLYLADRDDAENSGQTPPLLVVPLGHLLDDPRPPMTLGDCIDFLSEIGWRIGIHRSFPGPGPIEQQLPGPEYLYLHEPSSGTILFVLMKIADCDVFVVESMKPPYWSLHFRK